MSGSALTPDVWDDVLSFWFNELEPAQWFMASEDLDQTITTRFANTLKALASNPYLPPVSDDALLACSITAAHDVLAAVILVDQFSRNIHRGTAEAFAADPIGLALSNYLIDTGALRQFETQEIQFAVMPHMHTETRESQAICVQLFTEYNIEHGLKSAIEHQNIIDQFGRFPHRNVVLNRESTEAEKTFLLTGKAFGQSAG